MSDALPILAIDARPLSRGHGGIQKYTKEMLSLIVLAKQYKIILYSDKAIPELPENISKEITIRTIKIKLISRLLWVFFAPYWSFKDEVKFFWSPRHHLPLLAPKHCKTIITIHDFVWKVAPSTMPRFQLISERILMPFSIKKSNAIICVSKSTRNQLLDFFPMAERKSHVIFHGNTTKNSIQTTYARDQSDFFLAVGTLEPRKNYIRLLKAFEIYRKRGGNRSLVIVGKNGWKYKSVYEHLNSSEFSADISLINNCTDIELKELYNSAYAFLSPSIYEGYGLPPQEALAHGLPLMLSTIDAYLELYPTADAWVDPTSISSIADGLESIESQTTFVSQSNASNTRSWDDAAKELLECLATI